MTESDLDRLVEIKDEEALRAVVAHWLPLLKLTDWDVDAHLVPECELEADQVGVCCVDPPRRVAQIFLLRPETRRERFKSGDGLRYYGLKSMEVNVVHECLHIWTKLCGLNALGRQTSEGLAMEQMTEALATAFVGLHSYFGRTAA